MATESITYLKSKKFALRVVKLYIYLKDRKKENILSKQVLRSGTSIGANLAEAKCGISSKDFLSKVYIALKECSETLFWIDLLRDSAYITEKMHVSLERDCLELYKLLTATTKTLSAKLNANQDSQL